jgi:hypothetical protein
MSTTAIGDPLQPVNKIREQLKSLKSQIIVEDINDSDGKTIGW